MPNTGRIRYQEEDLNPNSPTFGAVRWGPWLEGGQACPAATRYDSAPLSEDVARNDCGPGLYGSLVRYTLPSGAFVSYTSQADADLQAQTHFNDTKQDWANQYGTCSATPPPGGSINWLPVYNQASGCFACLMQNSQDPTDTRQSTELENQMYYEAAGLSGPCVPCENA